VKTAQVLHPVRPADRPARAAALDLWTDRRQLGSWFGEVMTGKSGRAGALAQTAREKVYLAGTRATGSQTLGFAARLAKTDLMVCCIPEPEPPRQGSVGRSMA
jgi:hypothetical protein